MDGMVRMKRIRIICKMQDQPELSKKLGLKNVSCMKKPFREKMQALK